jgi:large subunit ribosomal protein L9
VIVKVRVGEEGKLFGSVTNADIAEALKEQHDFEIDKRKVDLTEPIKETGESTVRLELDSNVDANLKVIVTEL